MLYASVLLVSVVVRRRELLVCDNIMVNGYDLACLPYHTGLLRLGLEGMICMSVDRRSRSFWREIILLNFIQERRIEKEELRKVGF